MSTTVKTGWLKDKNGDKFAPKTLESQVQDNKGILLEDKITNINEIAELKTDWNQNNFGSYDYIKNRTHYKDFKLKSLFRIEGSDWLTYINDKPLIEVDKKYIVIINNETRYECVSYGTKVEREVCLGNGNRYIQAPNIKEYQNYPFILIHNKFIEDDEYYIQFHGENMSSIEVFVETDEITYHTLDKNYLPKEITASSDWQANQNEIGHIRNRTHYKEIELEYCLQNIQFVDNNYSIIDSPSVATQYMLIQNYTYSLTIDDIKYENLEVFSFMVNGTKYCCIGNSEFLIKFPHYDIIENEKNEFIKNPELLNVIDVPFLYITTTEIESVTDYTIKYIHNIYSDDIKKPIITLGKEINTTYYPLDENYIPNTIARNNYGVCETASSTTTKTVTIENFELRDNCIISIKFTNEVSNGSGLNINDTGFKSIYYNGSGIKNKVIQANDIATFIYNSNRYNLISIDRSVSNAGKQVYGTIYTINGTNITASQGSEIFNNYNNNKATGSYSHAEGSNTIAKGNYSHSEGYNTKAETLGSHSEGGNTTASGNYSHAEGSNTTASGNYSHSEGNNTTASSSYSHSEGYYTIANGSAQHAQGKYNISNSNLAHIVGNGTSSKRSNAHTLDWDGNAWFSGDIYVGSTSGTDKDDGSKKLVTEEYVDNINSDIQNQLDNKSDITHNHNDLYLQKNNPTGTGNFSLNRKTDTDIGEYSFTEGYNNTASGNYSHAEGSNTTASGNFSHAEGVQTIASGSGTHVEGFLTRATRNYSHVQGECNIIDLDSNLIHIVGNGTSDNNRSNAHTIDSMGNAWFASDVYIKSTSGTNKDEGSKKLATEEYADSKAPMYLYSTEDLEAGVSELPSGVLYFVYE